MTAALRFFPHYYPQAPAEEQSGTGNTIALGIPTSETSGVSALRMRVSLAIAHVACERQDAFDDDDDTRVINRAVAAFLNAQASLPRAYR